MDYLLAPRDGKTTKITDIIAYEDVYHEAIKSFKKYLKK
jgi:hypothetical protein